MMDGILIIDKPAGITSHDVVARCRRILRTKKIGHTGTLDPFATGVVVILVGRATRLAQFLDKDVKGYQAVVRFGYETDTGDRTGTRKTENGASETAEPNRDASPERVKDQRRERLAAVSSERIGGALPAFRGAITQIPPMYSAKKIDGKKLYELARRGIEVERKAVPVTIYELSVAGALEPATDESGTPVADVKMNVVCSAGTYIRPLAEDIGRAVGVGAHLAELRRVRAGKFELPQAVTLERLEELAARAALGDALISMNEAVSRLVEISMTAAEAARVKNGLKLRAEVENACGGDFVRLSENGSLSAIGVYDETEKTVQPKLVLV